ncbi:hypothetical protein A5320_14610 [Rheinheimera sp. SA_1]|uniref:DUF2804 domain-containing protein n=1 Tax=Rheinheimera sp. SA_1 TaxID=1827365 RepID=UPI0007FDB98A|nr:DUF2804 domain-containing protein [Rheinheimera sp. SA_1]OBP13904.1 hypothetical protein A5320_14610 [Rheinheimera sp. SA_1]
MSFSYLPRISQTPQQLIDPSGQPQFGLFEQSVPQLNFSQFDYRTVLDQPAGKLARFFAQKQFQFVTVSGDGWLLAVAIADIRYASSGFAYLYQADSAIFEKGLLLPLQFGCQMSVSPIAGVATLHAGKTRWSIEPATDSWQLQVDCGPLQANLLLHKQQQPPLALCAPTGYQGFTYTEKNNALPVTGQLSLAGKNFPLQQARAGYDFSAGFMRRQTNWRWASINTLLEAQPFGLNLAAGVNETGLCENALWLDGKIQHLSPAQFQFNRYNQESRWQIRTLCDELTLDFTPLFCRQEKVQAGLLASNFRQYVGHYQGEIRLRDGQVLQLKQCLGLAEDHYAKW